MEKVAQYLDQVFANLPSNEQSLQYRMDLQKQMDVVFRAECATGKSEDDALMVAIKAAPDYEAICKDLHVFETDVMWSTDRYTKQVYWNSFWFSFALGLMIVSPFGMIALSVWKHAYNLVAGLAVLIFGLGIACGILIYAVREKRALRNKRPKGLQGRAKKRFLILGILFCLIACIGLVFCLAIFEGKALSWECASCLIDAALGVMGISYYAQNKRWLKSAENE